MSSRIKSCSFVISLVSLVATSIAAQRTASISGTIIFEGNSMPLGSAVVRLVQLDRVTTTDSNGKFEFTALPEGRYTVIAHYGGFEDAARSIVLTGGSASTVDLSLRISQVREQVTVTATGGKQAAFDSVQPTLIVGSDRIITRGNTAIGEALKDEPGVAERTATPASSRPVIRGFDGDRVLVATDGFRTGSISALAGNEGEPIDTFSLDRIEVVRGPSTLLYGSNAIGGVVNAISRHSDGIQNGVRGYATAIGGTNNALGVGSGGVEYGQGPWGGWASGTLQRTNDYSGGASFGKVDNTATRMGHGVGGLGYFGPKGFLTFNYDYWRNRYGIPIDPADPEERTASIAGHRHDFRFTGGATNMAGFIRKVTFTFDSGRYFHRESEIFDNDPSTQRSSEFFNDVYSYRATAEQKRHGNWSGTFGFDGYHRTFLQESEEALIQGHVRQTLSAAYILEQLDLKRVTFQFGGRVEHAHYRPEDTMLPNRDLTGFSGSIGMRIGLWENGAFTANFAHATRLPDLEEFYNNGPHDDTVSFEVGDPHLRREVSDGLDLSVRHESKRLKADLNFYRYAVKNFVYLQPTGAEDPDTQLEIAEYVQADARFTGMEAQLDYELLRCLSLFANTDYVRTHFTTGVNLPRIPPLRARFGVEGRYKGLTLRPEVVVARQQDRVFTEETRTPGYTVLNLSGTYNFYLKRTAHTFGVYVFNIDNRLYFNHVSFVKDYTPETGRGVRFSYTIRFL